MVSRAFDVESGEASSGESDSGNGDHRYKGKPATGRAAARPQMRPWRCAHNAAEVRSLTPSTVKTRVRCDLTVFSLIVSRRAMLLFGRPIATRDRTSR